MFKIVSIVVASPPMKISISGYLLVRFAPKPAMSLKPLKAGLVQAMRREVLVSESGTTRRSVTGPGGTEGGGEGVINKHRNSWKIK